MNKSQLQQIIREEIKDIMSGVEGDYDNSGFEISNDPAYGEGGITISHVGAPGVDLTITDDPEYMDIETFIDGGEFTIGGKRLYWILASY